MWGFRLAPGLGSRILKIACRRHLCNSYINDKSTVALGKPLTIFNQFRYSLDTAIMFLGFRNAIRSLKQMLESTSLP